MKINNIVRMFAIILALSVFSTFAMPDDADAKRFGGGRSIGRTTTVRPSAPAGVTSSQQHFQQNSAINNSAAAGAAGAAAMSKRGMFGGLFGGLLAGTLLGSLLSGGGFAGGFGMLDLIIIGLLIYFGMKFFRNRQQNNNNGSNNHYYSQQSPSDYSNQNINQTGQNQARNNAAAAWDNLRSERHEQANTYQSTGTFNTEEFLTGAKQLYVRMQESWDLRDIEDIKQFTSPIMHKDIEEQFKEDPTPSKTQIILINASVLEVREEGDYEQAAVLFDVLMKEAENADNEQVREIWNFSRNKAKNGTWILDGIQSA